MNEIVRPMWLSGLRVVCPVDPADVAADRYPSGSWVVRHSIGSRALDELTRRGHRMYKIDDQLTVVAPALYIAR